jgi:hypothetical protein
MRLDLHLVELCGVVGVVWCGECVLKEEERETKAITNLYFWRNFVRPTHPIAGYNSPANSDVK